MHRSIRARGLFLSLTFENLHLRIYTQENITIGSPSCVYGAFIRVCMGIFNDRFLVKMLE
jgi:hypothetical protein